MPPVQSSTSTFQASSSVMSFLLPIAEGTPCHRAKLLGRPALDRTPLGAPAEHAAGEVGDIGNACLLKDGRCVR